MINNLGILGGGQLGMFICQSATKHNIKTIVFSDKKNFSAKKFCDNFLIGSFSLLSCGRILKVKVVFRIIITYI